MKRSAKRRTVFDLRQRKEDLIKLEQETLKDGFWSDNSRAQKISSEISQKKEEIFSWEKLLGDVASLADISKMSSDMDLEKEFSEVERKFINLERISLFVGKYDSGDAILNVYSGAGGDDAEEWAAILFLMYEKFARSKNWDFKNLHTHPNEFGGIKNASAKISGRFAFGYLKNENGVHRLVRISPFDASKRRHTSFALVKILPFVSDTDDVEIKGTISTRAKEVCRLLLASKGEIL